MNCSRVTCRTQLRVVSIDNGNSSSEALPSTSLISKQSRTRPRRYTSNDRIIDLTATGLRTSIPPPCIATSPHSTLPTRTSVPPRRRRSTGMKKKRRRREWQRGREARGRLRRRLAQLGKAGDRDTKSRTWTRRAEAVAPNGRDNARPGMATGPDRGKSLRDTEAEAGR